MSRVSPRSTSVGRRMVHRRNLGIEYLDGSHGPTLCHFLVYLLDKNLLDKNIFYDPYKSPKYTITISV